MARALRCGRRCITGAGRTPTASAVSDRVGDTVSWELRWMGGRSRERRGLPWNSNLLVPPRRALAPFARLLVLAGGQICGTDTGGQPSYLVAEDMGEPECAMGS